MVTAAQWGDKWSRRLKSASQDVTAGVDAVTTAPSAQAIAKKDKMRQNLLASIDNGTWENNLGKVTLQDYKAAMKGKGIQNMMSGVDSGTPKVTAFAAMAIPHIQQGQSMIEAMPDLTLQDSKARASAWIDHMANLKYKQR